MEQEILLRESNTVKDAVKVLEEKKIRGVFIVDDNMLLKGIFTQGDLRRFILKNGEMDSCIVYAMNPNPRVFQSISEARRNVDIVCPVINEKGQLIDVINNGVDAKVDILNRECLKNVPLVIMAGGMGKRLYPLTKILPKALIPIGEFTIAERIINNFVAWGCQEVYMILNHKAEMIKAYFDEKRKNFEMHYVQEEEFLGTGGGLSLLKGKVNSTFILSNCDILVDADFDCVLKTHYARKDDVTFIGAYKNMCIPYGVLHADTAGNINSIQEKPELSFLINTGVYVIEPSILEEMPENRFCHVTDFSMECRQKGKKIGVFPITENAWMDMGQFDEMKSMIKILENEE